MHKICNTPPYSFNKDKHPAMKCKHQTSHSFTKSRGDDNKIKDGSKDGGTESRGDDDGVRDDSEDGFTMIVDDMTVGDGYSDGDITNGNSSMTSGKVAGGSASESKTYNPRTAGTTIVTCLRYNRSTLMQCDIFSNLSLLVIL